MKRTTVILFGLLLSSVAHAGDEPTLDSLKRDYEQGVQKIEADHAASLTNLLNAYEVEVSKAIEVLKKQGDPKPVVAGTAELIRFQRDKTVPSRSAEDLPKALQSVQSRYNDAVRNAELQKGTKFVALTRQYAAALDGLMRRFTAGNKLDAAMAVQAEKERAERAMVAVGESGRNIAAPTGEEPRETTLVEVQAFIDGNSELHVTAKGLYWVCKGVAKPGRHSGRNEPTIINGKIWMPIWGKPREERGDDRTEILPLELKSLNISFRLIAVSSEKNGRGTEKRDAIRTIASATEYVVVIPDHQSGARWYRFELAAK